jgi:ribosomal protein S18 acetylase RimI-like enzyme
MSAEEGPLLVHAAREDDIPQTAVLAARLLREHHAWDPQRFLTVDDPERGYGWFLRRELDDEDAIVLVAREREGSPILGYVYGRVEPRSWTALLDPHGAIHDLYVDAAARGRGIGARLVEEIAAMLRGRGVPRIVLSTATKNVAGQKLFAALGFRPTMIEMTRELE